MPYFATARAFAQYRIIFSGAASGPSEETGARVAAILSEFGCTEIRIDASPNGGDILAFVTVPTDVTPEMLDNKARVLRETWE